MIPTFDRPATLLLAALAERTCTLRLEIAIVMLPLSHRIRIAEEIATLDVLSNGRVEFGIWPRHDSDPLLRRAKEPKKRRKPGA